MADINTNIYGAEETWLPATEAYAAGTQAKDKLRVVNFTGGPENIWNCSTIGKGMEANRLRLNTPWDKSLSYCALGSEAPLSNVEWFAKLPQESGGSDGNTITIWNKKDARYITNFALGVSAEGINGPYANGSNGYWVTGDQWSNNKFKFNRWNDGAVYNNDMSNYRTFVPYAAIPLHRVVLVPVVCAARTDNYTTTFDLANYLSDNHKRDYPRIRQIGMRIAVDYDPSKYPDIDEAPLQGFQRSFPGDGMREIAILDNTVAFVGEESDNYGPMNTTSTLGEIFLPMTAGCSRGGEQYCAIAGDLYGWASIQDNWQTAFLLRPFCSGFGLNFNKWSKVQDGKWKTGENGYLYCDASQLTDDEVREGVRHMVACFGLFFVDGEDDLNVPFYDDKMMLGILDGSSIGHGEYSHGEDNRNQKQWNMEDAHDFDYDPSSPPQPGDNPSGSHDPIPVVPLTWTLATAGGGVWALTESDINKVMNDIFGAEVKPSMYGDNPMDAIISLEWTPFQWSSATNAPIILGNTIVNQIHQYPLLNSINNAEQHEEGQVYFNFKRHFYNARCMQARLWLPFYGYYPLPMSQLLSSRMKVEFYYDVPDVVGSWHISFDGIPYDHVECNPNIEIPLTGSNAAAIKANKTNQAIAIGGEIVNTVLDFALIYFGGKMIKGSTNIANGRNAITGRASSNTLVDFTDGAASRPGSLTTTDIANNNFLGKMALSNQILQGANRGANNAQNIVNRVYQGSVERAALRTNLPYHGTASTTTFLHLPMYPYVQVFKNTVFENLERDNPDSVIVELGGTDEEQYMLKVGHACDIFTTIDQMPENSLLQTTGLADNDVSGMEMEEFNELNEIIQSGFYR